ncbi:MAG: DedA family protein [Chthonomonas sp.]|nr:DedA family protein [Chthonomonas sp.]
MLEQLIDPIKAWAEGIILSIGTPGIALLMGLDAANIPIPSEVIMPFGGMLAQQGKFNIHAVALAGTFGATIGSGVSYWVGALLGKDFLMKYGKFVLLRPKEIEHAERWFKKHGLIVTLWGRFIPLVRTFISLPAGFFRADFKVFMLYAFLGSLPWCYFWALVGWQLGENWHAVDKYMKYLDVVVLAVLAFFIGRFLLYRFRKDPKAA